MFIFGQYPRSVVTVALTYVPAGTAEVDFFVTCRCWDVTTPGGRYEGQGSTMHPTRVTECDEA
jgi:hypothetical protein